MFRPRSRWARPLKLDSEQNRLGADKSNNKEEYGRNAPDDDDSVKADRGWQEYGTGVDHKSIYTAFKTRINSFYCVCGN